MDALAADRERGGRVERVRQQDLVDVGGGAGPQRAGYLSQGGRAAATPATTTLLISTPPTHTHCQHIAYIMYCYSKRLLNKTLLKYAHTKKYARTLTLSLCHTHTNIHTHMHVRAKTHAHTQRYSSSHSHLLSPKSQCRT